MTVEMEKNRKLAVNAAHVAKALRAGADWVVENVAVVGGEAPRLRKDLLGQARQAERLARTAERPMTVSVFGPSQSGKSYLVSVVARSGQNQLSIRLGRQERDFLAEINPGGDKESTALVTRFTARPAKTPAHAPVSVSLLGETDIIKILGNTYIADSGRNENKDISEDEIASRLDRLQAVARPGAVDHLREDDIFDLQEYFEKNFRGDARVAGLKRGYWDWAAQLAPRLEIENRAELLAVLWGDIPSFTTLYVRLQKALANLGFESEACCTEEALVPREASILNVDTLDRSLHDPAGSNDDMLRIETLSGLRADLPRSIAAALVGEIRFSLATKPFDFFDHTDLLDFPGARSRQQTELTMREELAEKPSKLSIFFLRGKVAYLFDRYLAERELTSMLLCIGPSVQEVADLPNMITNWVETSHGETPAERARQETALFVVLTMFDRHFEEKGGEDLKKNPGERWQSRVVASIQKFLGAWARWPNSWTAENEPFNNVFWMRNPAIKASQLFAYSDDGSELDVLPSAQERIATLKSGYLSESLIRRYIAEPDLKWDAAMALNDGGAGLLVDRLRPVSQPGLKRRQVEGQLSRLCDVSQEVLERFFISDDHDEQARQRYDRAQRSAEEIAAVQKYGRFGLLLSRLMVNQRQAARLYRSTLTMREPDGSEDSSASTAFEISPVERFVSAILAEWVDDMRATGGSARIRRQLDVSESAVQTLIEELAAGAVRTGLRQALVEAIKRSTMFRMGVAQDSERVGLVTSVIVNNFVSQAGFMQMDDEERRCVANGRSNPFAPDEPKDGPIDLAELPGRFSDESETIWRRSFLALAHGNAWGGFSSGPDRSEQNRALKGILAALGGNGAGDRPVPNQ